VAHEINNPLSYVLLNLDFVLREIGERALGDEPATPCADLVMRLREARVGVDRVRVIVQDLKAFSRVDTERRGPVDVRRVLDEAIEIASNDLQRRARLVRAFNVCVLLPGVAAIEPPLRPSWSERRSTIPPPRAPRGRLLVVDDEPVLAAALGRSLEPEFEVEVLNNGRDAIARLRRAPFFDAILCDLIMPEMTGMDVYKVLKETDPDLVERIIFMTGGTFTQRARDFLASVPNPALDKPFDLGMLEVMLRVRTEGSEPIV